jgi:hypothetical protein
MAKRNKITPLRETEEVDNITETEENLETTDFDLETSDLLDSQEFQNLESQVLGNLDTSTDTSDIDTRLSQLDAPKKSDIWEKQAAMYRQQGEGTVLRTQRNLTNLFGPTLKVIAAKEKVKEAKFNAMVSTMKTFDDSKIFGQLNNSEIDIATEAKNISKTVKEDMRKLSRMNINHVDYDALRKKIESDQGKLANYDMINKTLLEIRNSGIESKDWSKGMTPEETAMWSDIFTSNGKNISIEDGKMYWQGEGVTTYDFSGLSAADKYSLLNGDLREQNSFDEQIISGGFEINKGAKTETVQENLNNLGITSDDGKELETDGEWGPKTQEAYDKYLEQKDELQRAQIKEGLTDEEKEEFGTTTTVDRVELNDESIGAGPKLLSSKATVDHKNISSDVIAWKNNGGKLGEMYEFHMGSRVQDYLDGLDESDVKSLIFDGFGDSKPDGTRSPRKAYSGFNTEDFMMDVLRGTYGEDMDATQIESYVNKMRSGSMYDMYTLNGEKDTLKNHFDNWYREEQKKWFEKDTEGTPVDPTKKKTKTKKKKKKSSSKTDDEDDFDNPYDNEDDEVMASDEFNSFNYSLLDKLDTPGATVGGRTFQGNKLLLNYSGNQPIKALNKEFGKYHFNFTIDYHKLGGDGLEVEFTHPTTGEVFKYSDAVEKGYREYDNFSGDDDLATGKELKKWMKKMMDNAIVEEWTPEQ